MFCLGCLYVDNEGDLALFLSSLIWFDRSDVVGNLSFFVNEVRRLAETIGVKRIRLEFHEPLSSRGIFPTSPIDLSYELDAMIVHREDLNLLLKEGFEKETSLLCYERQIDKAEGHAKEGPESLQRIFRPIRWTELFALREKERFSSRSYRLSNLDLIYDHRIIPFEILASRERRGWTGKERVNGYSVWSPDLFEPLRKHHIMTPSLFLPVVRDHPYVGGKVFEWGIADDDDELLLALIHDTLAHMRRRGLKKAQFDFVEEQHDSVRAALEQHEFRRIGITSILVKRLG
jgi:hypothetical protein